MKNKYYFLILLIFPFYCSAQNALSSGADNWFSCDPTSPIYFSRSTLLTTPDSSGLYPIAGIKSVSQRTGHMLALDTLNMVWGFNNGGFGQVGDSTMINHQFPVRTKGDNGAGILSNVWSISAGQYHSLFLMQDSTVLSCGYNVYGQLGDSTNSTRIYLKHVHGPGNIGNLDRITDICAGGHHSLALRDDGTVWSWGNGTNGVLGNGTNGCWYPIQVIGLSNIIAISTYGQSNLALKNDGTVWSWGENTMGELGNASFNNSGIPIQVHGLNNTGFLQNIIAISAGADYCLALAEDSTVFSWGYNNVGQLGDGTAINRNVPVKVLGLNGTGYLNDVRKIVAGYVDSYAETSDGRIFGWGDYSKLGNGATVNMPYPVDIILPCISTRAENLNAKDNTINVFPNPSNGIFKLSFQNDKMLNARFFLYNLMGEIVFESNIFSNDQQLDLSWLEPGVYVIKFRNEKEGSERKIVIQ